MKKITAAAANVGIRQKKMVEMKLLVTSAGDMTVMEKKWLNPRSNNDPYIRNHPTFLGMR